MNELLMTWLMNYLAHSTLLIGALWTFDRFVLARDPVRRERLWRAALIVPLVSAGLQVAAPEFAVTRPVTVAYSVVAPTAEVTPAPTAVAEPVPARAVVVPREREIGPWQWLVGLWLVGAAVLLARTAGSVVRGRRLLGHRRRVEDGAALRELDALARAAGLSPVSLSVSAVAPSPLTLPGREICLPARALALPADQMRGMLAHELAHIARGDVWQRLATTLFCALMCVQPLNFVARRRLADCAELNADDWARGLLGDGHPLARCLVTVATWLEPVRAPAFAAAMAESDRGLLARVRRLASADAPMRGWRGRGALFVLLAGALVMPGLVVTAEREDDRHESVSVTEQDNGSFTIRTSGRDGRLSMHATGAVLFSDDERGIASLAPGATLRIRTDDHALTVNADANGALSYAYEVNGDERPFDAAGRDWLAGLVPRLYRATGIQAEARVARIHARGGVDAVLDEIGLISSDFVAKRYFVALASTEGVTGAERVHLYELAGESIGSDFELRQALAAFPLREDSSAAEARALLKAAQEIGSDFELSELLMSVVQQLPTDDAVADAFIAAAAEIGSDFELQKTLSAAARSDWARGHLPRLIQVSAEIGSDFELARFLQDVLRAHEPDETMVAQLLALAADEVGSDHELLQVLLAAAPAVRRHPQTRALYERAAEELSDHEYGRAMRAISDA